MLSDKIKKRAITEFRRIPGVGPSIAQDLWNIGMRSLDDLRGAHAEDLYEALCAFQNARVDRCVLYVFRCAIYFASTENPHPELLKWWKWKDR